MFSELTIEKIGYYVYCLMDPRDNSTFYIGKGRGNRVFSHANAELVENSESEKLEIIKDILDSGNAVKHYIIRYGLNEKEALEVEAALIDYLGVDNLSNCVRGHQTSRGKISCEELEVLLGAEEVEIADNVLIIRINKLFKRDMTIDEVYEATRKAWVLSKVNVKKVDYVLSVCDGIIRGVFTPKDWFEVEVENGKSRLGFNGNIAEPLIVNKYFNKSITNYLVKGNSNPIMYVLNSKTGLDKSVISNIEVCSNKKNQYIVSEKEVDDNIDTIDEKVMLIKINQGYRSGISKEELYNVTRHCWRVTKENADKVDYVFSIYKGEVLEVYEVDNWYKVEEEGIDNRCAFNGKVANCEIRDKYVGRSVKNFYKRGEAFPCKYINII